jgi:N,N'-diacetyllegionaminate synthase
MTVVKIADRQIGEGRPCFIIAEAGVNHNGDIGLAKKLIDAAHEAGADAVKFQTFKAEAIVTADAEKAEYQKVTTGSRETQIEMLKKLELKHEDFRELFTYARNKGIIFLSSPFDSDSVDLLDRLGVTAFKIPSGEITNIPLLRHIAGKGKPVILSTGMSDIDEVKEAVKVLRKNGAGEIVLLHCVSAYPARVEETNLRAMATLRRQFNLPVGLSDHTVGIHVPVAAVALGASVIEKHFTLDKKLPGPDHRASLEPGELKEMVAAIRDIEKALGDGIKRTTAEEADTKKAARRSLVTAKDIPAGTVITGDMLDIKRPGTGLEPKFIIDIIGKKAVKALKSGEIITLDKVTRA